MSDAGDTLSDMGCRSLPIGHEVQETLYQRGVAGVSLSDSVCRRHSIRQQLQESLYQTSDAGLIPLIESLLHLLSDRESLHPLSASDTPATDV